MTEQEMKKFYDYLKDNDKLYKRWSVIFKRSLPSWMSKEDVLQDIYLKGLEYYERYKNFGFMHRKIQQGMIDEIHHWTRKGRKVDLVNDVSASILLYGSDVSKSGSDFDCAGIPFANINMNAVCIKELVSLSLSGISKRYWDRDGLLKDFIQAILDGKSKKEIKVEMDIDDSVYCYLKGIVKEEISVHAEW